MKVRKDSKIDQDTLHHKHRIVSMVSFTEDLIDICNFISHIHKSPVLRRDLKLPDGTKTEVGLI